jgi:hypothetical protein
MATKKTCDMCGEDVIDGYIAIKRNGKVGFIPVNNPNQIAVPIPQYFDICEKCIDKIVSLMKDIKNG